MTKPLDPEFKAIYAIDRALSTLDRSTQRRVLQWLVARFLGMPGWELPSDRVVERWKKAAA